MMGYAHPHRAPSTIAKSPESYKIPKIVQVNAVGAVDGRYGNQSYELGPYFSERALFRYRLFVEAEYLIALSRAGVIRRLGSVEVAFLHSIWRKLTPEETLKIKAIEEKKVHDVQATVDYMKDRLKGTSLEGLIEWIHFGLTSEDIDNLAYTLAMRDALKTVMIPRLERIYDTLFDFAQRYGSHPMLGRTHGQAATPTTVGKEFNVFAQRLREKIDKLRRFEFLAKSNGATGNDAARIFALPQIDWPAFTREFIGGFSRSNEPMPIVVNEVTTQIEPCDRWVELFDVLKEICPILVGMDQDIWRYISDHWVKLKAGEGQTGSSTMAQKINPIDFENSEGNEELGQAILEFYGRKFPISRLQRDLSNSTVRRSIGMTFATLLIGYNSALKGFGKISINEELVLRELAAHPEVLAEAYQQRLRVAGEKGGYETMRKMTQGRDVTLEELRAFAEGLRGKIPDEHVDAMVRLTPDTYIGRSAEIALMRVRRSKRGAS